MVAADRTRRHAGRSGQPSTEEDTTVLPITGPPIIADVAPNTTGLPGISSLSNIVGALLTIGLIACVAGLVLAAIVWAIGSHSSNPNLASRGKSGVLIALVAAILIGGANVLVDFFVTAGQGL
jgi:hypothetical protein